MAGLTVRQNRIRSEMKSKNKWGKGDESHQFSWHLKIWTLRA
jgi:hypothetical protein